MKDPDQITEFRPADQPMATKIRVCSKCGAIKGKGFRHMAGCPHRGVRWVLQTFYSRHGRDITFGSYLRVLLDEMRAKGADVEIREKAGLVALCHAQAKREVRNGKEQS